jgi:hypothetical protein
MAGDAEATRFVARRSTLLRAFGRLASRRARRRYPSLPLRSLEYTTPQARPIIYAVGDFLETDLRDGRMLARPRGAAMAANNRGRVSETKTHGRHLPLRPGPHHGGGRLTRQPAAGETASG